MDNLNTTDSILSRLEHMSASREPIDPNEWLTGATKLLALVGNEQNQLYDLEHLLARVKFEAMELGATAAKAKTVVEARGEFLECRKLKAKIERVMEIVKISKLMSKLSNDEMRFQR